MLSPPPTTSSSAVQHELNDCDGRGFDIVCTGDRGAGWDAETVRPVRGAVVASWPVKRPRVARTRSCVYVPPRGFRVAVGCSVRSINTFDAFQTQIHSEKNPGFFIAERGSRVGINRSRHAAMVILPRNTVSAARLRGLESHGAQRLAIAAAPPCLSAVPLAVASAL